MSSLRGFSERLRPNPSSRGGWLEANGRTVVWLWWILWFRRWHREGPALRAVGIVVAALALAMGGGSFLAALGLGLWLLPGASPLANLLVWDALVAAYAVVRLSGLLVSTQRTDAVPLARLLHLPISPRGVFALNFVIAETTFATVVFVPALLGLAIASTVAVDVAFAVLVPGSLALGLCVVAVAYQFRTWLASTMARGRRRIPVGIVLLFSAIVAVNGFNLFLQFEEFARTARNRRQGCNGRRNKHDSAPYGRTSVSSGSRRTCASRMCCCRQAGSHSRRNEQPRVRLGRASWRWPDCRFSAVSACGGVTDPPWIPIGTVWRRRAMRFGEAAATAAGAARGTRRVAGRPRWQSLERPGVFGRVRRGARCCCSSRRSSWGCWRASRPLASLACSPQAAAF